MFDLDKIILSLIILLLICFINIKHLRFNKRIIYIEITLFIIALTFKNLNLSEPNTNEIFGIVIKKSENYVILKTFFSKYYVYGGEDLHLFDVIKIKGNIENLNFIHYESSFDFEKYLLNQGVKHSLIIDKYDKIINFPINFNKYKEKVLSLTDNETFKIYLNLLLFKERVDGTNLNRSIISLLSLSGIYLNFLLYGLAKFFNLFLNERHSRIISLIVLAPLLFFEIYKFSVIKVTIFYIFSIYSYKKEFDNIKRKSFLYLLFLIFDVNLLYAESFYISLIFSLFFQLSSLFINKSTKIKKYIKTKLVFILVFVPFSIQFCSSLNFLNLIFNACSAGFFKIFYSFCTLYFYGINIKFMENIFVKVANFLFSFNFEMFDINIPKFSISTYILYFVIIISLFYFLEINYKKLSYFYTMVLITFLIIYSIPIKEYFTFEVSFLNVGQGDSTYIHYKDEDYLIDTGGLLNYDLAINSLIPFLKNKKVYDLDAVFITHYDYDHFGALDSLKNNFKVKKVLDYNSNFPFKTKYFNFINLNTYENYIDENEKSLVLYLKTNVKKFLFMGDATKNVEEDIINKNPNLDIDILKLGHHGSKTSSSYNFLRKVSPEVGIISCGKNNKFHHPNDETINNLKSLKIPYRRTDIEGTITYKFNIFNI